MASLSSLRVRIGATLLVVAAVQYLVLEAITASAWVSPSYDYAYNFISDLGDPIAADVYSGRQIDSPLSLVMNAAFVLQGALFITGAALLLPTVGRWLGASLLALAALHGVGVIVVGIFHESSVAAGNGLIALHSVGATGAIVAGNAFAIVIGIFGSRVPTARGHQVASVILGTAGIVAAIVLVVDRGLDVSTAAVPERIAVYTIIAWEAVTGVAVLRSRSAGPPSLDRAPAASLA